MHSSASRREWTAGLEGSVYRLSEQEKGKAAAWTFCLTEEGGVG